MRILQKDKKNGAYKMRTKYKKKYRKFKNQKQSHKSHKIIHNKDTRIKPNDIQYLSSSTKEIPYTPLTDNFENFMLSTKKKTKQKRKKFEFRLRQNKNKFTSINNKNDDDDDDFDNMDISGKSDISSNTKKRWKKGDVVSLLLWH